MSLTHLLDLIAASGAVGTFLPLVISLVNQEHWSSKAKGVVTAALSTAAGLITAWGSGDFTGASPVVAVVVVLLVASVAFHAFWAPTKLADLIEAATTFARSKLPAHAAQATASTPAPPTTVLPPAPTPPSTEGK